MRVVASRTGSFYGQPMIAGHIYTIAGTGKAGYAGDGGARRHQRLPRACRRRADGQLLRPAHDRRGHLHDRRRRAQARRPGLRLFRRPRASDQRPAGRRVRDSRGRRGQHRGRRPGERQDPARGRPVRAVLRPPDEGRRYLRRRRQRTAGLIGRWRPGHEGRVRRAGRSRGRQRRQPSYRRRPGLRRSGCLLRQHPRPRGGGQVRAVLRPSDDGRPHLHHRGHAQPVYRPGRAGHARADQRVFERHLVRHHRNRPGRPRQPADHRRRRRPDPGGGGALRPVLRPGDAP